MKKCITRNSVQTWVIIIKKHGLGDYNKTPVQKMKETAVFWSSYVTINPKIHFFQLSQIHFKNQQVHAVAIKILHN